MRLSPDRVWPAQSALQLARHTFPNATLIDGPSTAQLLFIVQPHRPGVQALCQKGEGLYAFSLAIEEMLKPILPH